MTKKKDILDELMYREISKCDEIYDVFEKLKIINIPSKGYLSESDLFCWIENNPSLEEKKKVLTALGYDVSKL